MPGLWIAVIIIGIIAMVIAIIIWTRHLEKKRREAIEAFANEMGLEFFPKGDAQTQSKMQRFKLFQSGHGRRLKNLLVGETDFARITMFDYQFTTGSGKHQHTHVQTVVAMESPALTIPSFTMRPESMFDTIGSVFGFQDIDFDNHPEFSKMFVLKGESETAIRQFFDQMLLDFFAGRKGIAFECENGIFIYYRSNRVAKPDVLRDFLNDGYTIYSEFVNRIERG